MDDQVISLRASYRVIRRYPRLLLVSVLIGFLVGLGYAVVVRPMSSAQSLVLMPASALDSNGLPTRDVKTDIAIAMSPRVLDPASDIAGLTLSFSSLQRQVVVTAPTSDILQIEAQGSTAIQAIRLANAVAASFIKYANSSSIVSGGVLSNLEQQTVQLGRQVQDLTSAISKAKTLAASVSPTSSSGKRYQSLLLALQLDLGTTQLALSSAQSQIDQAKLSGASPNTGTVALEWATTAKNASVLRIPEIAALGALGGIVVGALIAFARGSRDQRLRRRDDISEAASVPVLASLSGRRPKTEDDWLHLLEDWRPSVTDRAHLRRLLEASGVHNLAPRLQLAARLAVGISRDDPSPASGEPGVDVTFIALARDRRAMAVAPELAVFAAELGLPTAFVVNSDYESSETLKLACAARDPHSGGPRANLLTYERPPELIPVDVTLRVTLLLVEANSLDVVGYLDAEPATTRPLTTLLAVSAGEASADELESVATAVARHGPALDGVVVVDPDAHDTTVGLSASREVRHVPRRVSIVRKAAR